MSDVLLIVVDGHKLRRSAIVGLMVEWVARHQGRVVGVDAVEPIEAAIRCEATMVMLSVGGSFSDPRWEAAIRILRGLDDDRPVVVLSDTETPRDILGAFRAGARGFLPTSLPPEVAFDALSFILRGGAYVPPSILAACHSPVEPPSGDPLLRRANERRILPPDGEDVAAPATPEAPEDDHHAAVGDRYALTERQSVVLDGLCRGESNKEIARDLDMSEATVKVHVRQVLRKLGATNRTQAALIASRSRADRAPRWRRPKRPSDPPVMAGLPPRVALRPDRFHA